MAGASDVPIDGAHAAALVADFEAALDELTGLFTRDPARWERRPANPRKWSAGGHAEHIARTLEAFAAPLEEAERALVRGALPAPPRRGLLQRALVHMLVYTRRPFPRGGKAREFTWPEPGTTQAGVLQRIRDAGARLTAPLARLSPEQRDRLWIHNPIVPAWHYRWPEILRLQARHARHHAAQAAAL